MILPDLVIGGAPKTGTSSLFRWLADHPGACGSTPKEPYFLMDAGHPLCGEHNVHRDGLEGYARFFRGCDGGRVRLEATTHYLYQDTAPRVLAHLDPVPLSVFLLREPARRVYSAHAYTMEKLGNLDRGLDFPTYIEAVRRGDRELLREMSRSASSAEMLFREIEHSRYVRWLDRWEERVSRERMHVILFEDLVRRPRAVVEEVAARLQLDPGFYAGYEFPRLNRTYRVGSVALHHWARGVGRRLEGSLLHRMARAVYFGLNVSRERSGPGGADRRVLEDLREAFEEDNRELARRWGLDLSAWRS